MPNTPPPSKTPNANAPWREQLDETKEKSIEAGEKDREFMDKLEGKADKEKDPGNLEGEGFFLRFFR